jgi:hypothetical protein
MIDLLEYAILIFENLGNLSFSNISIIKIFSVSGNAYFGLEVEL